MNHSIDDAMTPIATANSQTATIYFLISMKDRLSAFSFWLLECES